MLTRRGFLKLVCGFPFLNLVSFAQIPATDEQQTARPWAFAKRREGNGLAFPAYFVKERPTQPDKSTHKVFLPLGV